MRSVIIGKSKTVVSPMPSNLLVVGGSFTGRLKIYDRDTLQEVTGVDTSAMTAINSLAYDSDYIYVGGTFSAAPYARKISRTTRAISAMASGAPNNPVGANCVLSNNGTVYALPNDYTTGRYYIFNIAAATATYTALGQLRHYNAVQTTDHIYVFQNSRGLNFWIKKMVKQPLSYAASLTLSGSAVRSLTVDSNFLYFGSTTSGDFHVYDLALTTEQTGYPTIPSGVYSILNDDTNIYIGSSSGNVYVINKATKALTTTVTGLGANIFSLSQTSDLLYIASATGIVKIGKSNLSTVYSVLNGLSSVNTIMAI